MRTDPKLLQVISYLNVEFPGFSVAQSDGKNEDEIVIRLELLGQTHVAIVQQAFLDAVAIEDLHIRLEEYRLAATLRDIGEFPIIVSTSGCIFA